jgi:chaperonin cofactor prefoldin
MGIDILVNVAAAVISLLPIFFFMELLPKGIRRLLKRDEPEETYTQKLSRLTESLTRAFKEVDSVLTELAQVARDREKAVGKLELDLRDLESRERQLQQRIQDLENVPLPVTEHFATLIKSGERRSVLRDYMLFGAGVVVSTVMAIILKIAGLG